MAQMGQHTDVIFVVEGTALCGAYLHELRSQYIIPTLEYFSGPIDEKDCGSDSNYCLFGLVVFHAADALPGVLIDTIGPLNTSYKLLCQIDRIRFNGGHGEAMSSVAEGLASAMECLDDLANFRNTLTDAVAKKHIILVCNCKPYGVSVSGSEGLSDEYVGKTVEQLAADMTEKEIRLSIMSPRKIPSLIQLFDHAGGDVVNQKGYSRDVRHLILLNGFSLKVNDERPPSPARMNQENFPLSTTPHGQQQLSNTVNPTMQLPVGQPQQSVIPNMQNPHAVSQQSPMMQLPRSPVSSVMSTSGMPLPQHSQNSPMGVGMQSPSTGVMQQTNIGQLSQQSMQLQQQQMFPQQQQPFRNPRSMTPPTVGQVSNSRGTMMSPHQQQMNQHLQMNSQQVGQQQAHINKIQQQAFQQQQQQAQLQSMTMQQQNILQQQNLAQNQSQQMNMQIGMQQQQNQLQQNLLQQQQNQMQQQGQVQILQQGQPMQPQTQMPMLQGTNAILQQQNILQQNQIGQQQQVQNPLQNQQNPNPMQQQGQVQMQQQPGQISISPGPRWPNQMGQQMQMAQQARMQTPNQIPPHPQPTSSPLQRPPQEIIARLNQPPMVRSPGAPNTNAAMGNIQQQLGSPTMQRERRIIWNGYLEWHEKQKGTPEGLKIPRQVPCQVSSTVVNNETEVKGDGWPSKLIMQLIPKQIVGNLGGTYFLDVKTVLFILQNCDALVSLTKVMDSGFAGCVHFTGSGMPQNACTIKVLILLYSKERNAYLGFIPNDQAGFVDRIRKVIQQQKTQQAATRGTVPGIPPSIPQTFTTGPGMQGGMVIQGQGQSQQQQPSPGLPVSVQQMSNQPQMMSNTSQLQQQLGTATQMAPSHNTELERQQNALRIQQLKQELEQAEAQQRGLNYNQHLQSTQGQGLGPGQMMGQGQMIQNTMGNQSQLGGQGQGMSMQQGQMITGIRPGMTPRLQQGPGTQLNTRLKHLLQQPGTNVGQGTAGFNRMRMPTQNQQNQMPQQPQQQGSFHEDLGILDLLK